MKPVFNPFTGDLQLINQDGLPGAGIVVKGAYNPETDYTVGDSVSYEGSSYVMYVEAIAGTIPTDTSKWQVVANKGADGTDGTNGTNGTDGEDGIGITPQDIGFTLTGGTTPKTLTVALDSSIAGTNTGDQDLSGKVDKVAGKSLVSDTEISKIHALHADDQDLSGLVVKESGKSLVADTEIAKIHASGSDNQDLSGLVVKEAGKSLVADTEIAKIHASGSDNQDLSGLEPKQAGKSLSTNDFTDDLESKLIGIEAGANNYTHPATHSADIIIDGTTNKVYTATEQSKLSGIATGAEVNVQSDWNQATDTADDFIKNKPTIPTLPVKASGAEINAGTDDAKFATSKAISDSKLARIIIGTCTTARTTAAKEVTISDYTLRAGDTLAITFSDGFSVNSATLNVNGTGAVAIKVGGVAVTTSLLSVAAGTSFTLNLYYDGTSFYTPGSSLNTTYSVITEAEITAGTATTARSISGQRSEFIVTKARNGLMETTNKAIGTDINTGTDDSKYVTSKAITDSNIIFSSDLSVYYTKTEVDNLLSALKTQLNKDKLMG